MEQDLGRLADLVERGLVGHRNILSSAPRQCPPRRPRTARGVAPAVADGAGHASRPAVSGEKAGRHTAMYSAPSGPAE
ncbi:hypothetical protein Skr01_13530 [Sphaerisporangium krabiense]|nr:hypothetical protein Skr01_13530 [Sphaerisporangium krabiense]